MQDKIKNVVKATVGLLLASTTMATAGGIERTSQSVGIIFEEGTYAEFSLSHVMSSVSGIDPAALNTGIMSPNYSNLVGGFKSNFWKEK